MERYRHEKGSMILDKLGRKYIDLISEDQFDYKNKFDMGKRTDLQIRIANIIISKSENIFKRVAHEMNYGDGWRIKKGVRISLTSFKGLEGIDLVQEGALGVLENLHKYNGIHPLKTFMGIYAAERMQLSARKCSQIPLSINMFKLARFTSRKAKGEEEQRNSIAGIPIKYGSKMNENVAQAIYIGTFGGRAQNINGPAFLTFNDGASWQDVHLKDDAPCIENRIECSGITRRVKNLACFCGVSERDVDIIKERACGVTLSSLAKKYSLTGEAIRKAEKKAIRKLRESSEKIVAGLFVKNK